MTTRAPKKLWWLPDVKEFLAFMLGAFILVHQTVYAERVEPTLVAAAMALIGLFGAGFSQRALKKVLDTEEEAK